jgi:hypothetical protein
MFHLLSVILTGKVHKPDCGMLVPSPESIKCIQLSQPDALDMQQEFTTSQLLSLTCTIFENIRLLSLPFLNGFHETKIKEIRKWLF